MPSFMVASPDGRKFQITAPEGATQDQVLAYAQQNHAATQTPAPQGPSTFEDTAKSIGSNLVQGAATIPMALPNMINALAAGPQYLGRGIAEGVDKMIGIDPQPRGDIWQPFYGSGDAVQTAGLDYQPKTAMGAAMAIPAQITGSMLASSGMNQLQANPPKFLTDQSSGSQIPPPASENPNVGVPLIKNTLLAQNPDVRTYAGEQLGQKLQGAEQAAYTAKNEAYKAAEEPSKNLMIGNNAVSDLTTSLANATEGFNPRVVNNVNGIQDTIDALNKDAKAGQISWARIDQARQELYNLPKSNDAEAAVRGKALSAYHDYANKILDDGLIQGDTQAIDLVKQANAKNALWRQQFTGKDANNAIRTFIENQGGSEQIAPENLLDMFTRVGQVGLDNVKAAKDVLGDDAIPLLKQGYLDHLRTASIDNGGNIVPARLSKNINALITKNPTLTKFVFTPEEVQAMNNISNMANRYATGAVKPYGFGAKVASKLPLFGGLVEDLIKSGSQDRMVKGLAKAAK